jgi:hypothetical protein
MYTIAYVFFFLSVSSFFILPFLISGILIYNNSYSKAYGGGLNFVSIDSTVVDYIKCSRKNYKPVVTYNLNGEEKNVRIIFRKNVIV